MAWVLIIKSNGCTYLFKDGVGDQLSATIVVINENVNTPILHPGNVIVIAIIIVFDLVTR